jgi:hypothetical protein
LFWLYWDSEYLERLELNEEHPEGFNHMIAVLVCWERLLFPLPLIAHGITSWGIVSFQGMDV